MSNKPVIHFAHANGFPAGSYNKLFGFLQQDVEILALDKFAHDPEFPVSNNWVIQAKELIQFLEKNSSQPIHGVGHSFGAVITFIAACKRPDLFTSVTMLDPPIASGIYAFLMRLVKKTSWIEKVTPALLARQRRQQWPLGTDLFNLYRGKGIFRHMDPQCVRDYLAASIDETQHHYQLNFCAETEANIFTSVPDNLGSYNFPDKVPLHLIRGEFSDVTKYRWIRSFVKDHNAKVSVFSGGFHMFPLEQPELMAKTLINHIKKLEQQQITG